MNRNNDLSRITLDIPRKVHIKLKARAAILGKSMRAIILEALELTEECRNSDHIPNKETRKTIENIKKGKNLTKVKSARDLFKKLEL